MAFFVADTVAALYPSVFYQPYEGDSRRNQPYDPGMMVKVLHYAYAMGTFSSRKIARRLEEDIAYRVLAAQNFPAHRTICVSRQQHLDAFGKLFVQVVEIARQAGLVKLGPLVADGSKVKANASKHKARSLSNNAADNAELLPLLKQVKTDLGTPSVELLADAGCRLEKTFQTLETKGFDAYVSLGRESKHPKVGAHLGTSGRMAKKLAGEHGKKRYGRRKVIVEPVLVWIEEVLGSRRFRSRGQEKAREEWILVCLAVDLKRFHVLQAENEETLGPLPFNVSDCAASGSCGCSTENRAG